jgi:hypothetical protein
MADILANPVDISFGSMPVKLKDRNGEPERRGVNGSR